MANFYITTPIYYVNAKPHLGHAYTTIVADAATRFHKMKGEKTLFLTGTDEHGDKIVQAAEKANLSPAEFVDEISGHFRSLWPKIGAAPDVFTRTTNPGHQKAVQAVLQKLYDAGDIYFGEFGGYYCYGCERFYTEKELENGLCPQHRAKPEYVSESNYFFKMSKYLPWLKEYLQDRPDLIRPERYLKETLAMLDADVLEDLCISRPKSRLTWGIELPFDSNYVCYVWFDALFAYLSELSFPDGEEYKEFWPGRHLIAKDILKPHAIFWPCMLKAADLPIYKSLEVHGYWLSRDAKMSKSLGNVVEPLDAVERFGLDAFRYYLLREMNFGSDANFSEESIVSRINADLANDLGNLFSRALSMYAKYFDGVVQGEEQAAPEDGEMRQTGLDAAANYLTLFENFEFSHALDALWVFTRALNKYIDTQAPWTLAKKGEKARLAAVLNLVVASLRKIALCLWPVMPEASARMLSQLGETQLAWDAGAGKPPITNIEAEKEIFTPLPTGHKLAPASNLFPRIDLNKSAEPEEEKVKPVKIDVFNSLDIRVGEIMGAQKHPQADRILVLTINFKEKRPRQILSGLAEYYQLRELVGKKVCAILNLEPRKIRGLTSEGMVLTTEADGKVRVLEAPEGATIGAKIS